MMKKIISLLVVIVTLTLSLCSCGRMGKVIEAYNDASTIEPAETVDDVALGVETYLATTTHDIGRYAMFQVEGKIISDNEIAVRTWLVCYLDKDSDVNWYIVTWNGNRYEKYAFQPE